MIGRVPFLLGLLLAGTGCSPVTDATGPACGAAMRVYQLYFGRAMADGGQVSDADWAGFREGVITPNLPAGYTLLDAEGAWASPRTGRTIAERTKLLIVALPDRPDSTAAVNRVRAAYQTQFRQQSVGLTAHPACGSF